VLGHPPCGATRYDRVRHYFDNGLESARKLAHLTAQFLPEVPRPSILEFASGYGCVTRHLLNVMPHAQVTACDIHPQANSFVQGLGFDTVASASAPEDFNVGRKFDVVFALSFFTHMPRSTWARWLYALMSHRAARHPDLHRQRPARHRPEPALCEARQGGLLF
jgi:hypothetical protein